MSDRNNFFWSVISKIPVLKRLREVPAEALKEARAEIGITTIFAAMPFWFPIVAYLFLVQPPEILQSAKNGELLIYAATLVGPLAYIITKRYGRYVAKSDDPDEPDTPLSYPFPEGRTVVTLAMVVCILAGVAITLQKIQNLPQLSGVVFLNSTGVVISSIALFLFSTLLLFCVSAYRNFVEMLAQDHSDKISRAQQRGEEALAAEWQERKDADE